MLPHPSPLSLPSLGPRAQTLHVGLVLLAVILLTGCGGHAALSAGPPAAPLPPANLSAEADGADAITLSWDAPATDATRATVTHYAVQRSASGAGGWSDLATVSATGYRDSNLDADTTYHYRVRARSGGSLGDAVGALSPAAYWAMDAASGRIPDGSGNGVTLGTSGVRYGQPPVLGASSRSVSPQDGAGYAVAPPGSSIANIFDDGGAVFFSFRADSVGHDGLSGYLFDKWHVSLALRGDGLRFRALGVGAWRFAESVSGGLLKRDIAGVLVYDDSSPANDPVLYLLLDNDAATIAVTPTSELQAPSGSRSDDSKAALLVSNGHSAREGFDGRIDDLALFGQALTAAQARSLLASAASAPLSSPWSASVSATTERKAAAPASLLAPLAPSNLAAAADGESAIRLSWNAPAADSARAAVTRYAVQRSASGTGGWSDLATTSATSYRDGVLQADATWHYRVRAETAKSGLHSDWSASASATTEAKPPAPVTTAPTFRYDRYDTTGQVAQPGSYAFLKDDAAATGDGRSSRATSASVITTYEGLRTDATRLLLHETDAGGMSRASSYNAVQVGHLIEWRKADDCFVRYRVTDAPVAGTAAPHREFGLRPETYAFQSCQTGSLPQLAAGASATAAATLSAPATITAAAELPLEPYGGTRLTSFAVIHGPWQLTPYTQPQPGVRGSPPAGVATEPFSERQVHARFRPPSPYRAGDRITSLAEVKRLFPYWRDPKLPVGWTFSHLYVGGGIVAPGYWADFYAADGYPAVTISAYPATVWPLPEAAAWLTNHDPPERIVQELRVIAGRPALVQYSPLGPQHHPTGSAWVSIYDAATQTTYEVEGVDPSLRGGPAALERVIAIALSLFENPNPR